MPVYRLLDFLDRLNRKERFFLIGQALGNPTFSPDAAFLADLAKAVTADFPEPDQIHCFMDYHLDWLYAALILSTSDGNGPFESPAFPPAKPSDPPWNVNANQEDIDMLLAFEQAATTHLVMVEAKAATGWTVKQIASKSRRLRRIFGEDGCAFENVQPHFVLMSPSRSKALDKKLAAYPDRPPAWMLSQGKLSWAELRMPKDRLLIIRCDEKGNAAKTGEHWRRK